MANPVQRIEGGRRRVLVTGAAGLVGAPLVAALCERGDEVFAGVRPGGRSLPAALRERLAQMFQGDGPDWGLPAVDVDCVFHLAAAVDPRDAADPRRCERVNVDGT